MPYFGVTVEAMNRSGKEAEMASTQSASSVAVRGTGRSTCASNWERTRVSWTAWSTTGSSSSAARSSREVLHGVEAPSEEAIRALRGGSVGEAGLVTVTSVERWTILLDGRSKRRRLVERDGAEVALVRARLEDVAICATANRISSSEV